MAKKHKQSQQTESIYFLKLVLYLIAGSFWVKLSTDTTQIPLPVGPLLGLWFASHEHFRIDRKIEYAVLLVASLVGFWAPVGLFILL